MPYISTEDLKPSLITNEVQQQAYNALDCCVTFEVHNELNRIFNQEPDIYSFERALQGPYLEIMQRGFLVDQTSRQQAARELRARIETLQSILDELAVPVWGRGLNPRSPKQLKDFFYKWLALPEQWISQKGERKLSTNREVLEKLEQYMYARPIIACILLIRDCSKQLQTFEIEIDSDGRFRTSYNIAGTESGRPSSSSNAFGTGGNAQNIAPSLRYPFIADKGFKLACIDLEQVEARDVGWFEGVLFGDWAFLNACECVTGDHEVLTKNGWVRIKNMPDEIAVWQNSQIRFERPVKWNKGLASHLIECENIAVSILATPNHTMPIYSDRNKYLEKRTLSELEKHRNKTSPNTGKYKSGTKLVREASLIAAFQADGTRDDQGKVHWSFMKKAKIDRMQKLLDKYEYKYSRYELGSGATRFYLHMGQGQDQWKKECNAEILEWDEESLNKFCYSHYFWDGSFEGSNVRIVAKSRNHLDWLQTAYALNGKATTINQHKDDYWILNVRSRENHQFRSAHFTNELPLSPKEVFCPTVSSGFFLLRRKGKIFISGNSGDLHTNNSKLVWPELGWTGDPIRDRKIADGQFYREFSYRDMSKRGGHLSNYKGTAWTMSRSLKIPLKVAEEFQSRYCLGLTCAFPAHQKYWQWIAEELQTTNKLTTPFGRVRHFFGRPGDDTTLREAIAFLPQSTTADRMNLGLWKVWKHMPEVQLLGQGFDSITFQYKGPDEDIIPRALKLLEVELFDPKSGRRYCVPAEAKVGWNWGAAVSMETINQDRGNGRKPLRHNPDGLVKWKPGKPDLRVRQTGFNRLIGT